MTSNEQNIDKKCTITVALNGKSSNFASSSRKDSDTSGCSSARLEYTSGGRVVAGSNPVIPTKQFSKKRKPVVSLEATGFFVVVLLLDILRLKYPYWAQHYKKLCYLLQ